MPSGQRRSLAFVAIIAPLLLVGGLSQTSRQATAGDSSGPTVVPAGVDLDTPAVVAADTGDVDLFTPGATTARPATYRNSLGHRTLSGYGWSPDIPVGGGGGSSAPAAAASAPGTLQVFTKGSTGVLLEKTSTSPGAWSPWTSVGGLPTGRAAAAAPGRRQLDVYSPQADGSVWIRSADTVGTRYRWSPLGGALAPSSGVAAVATAGGSTVVVRRADNTLWSRSRNASGQWSDWVSLGAQQTLSDPAVASSAPGRLDIYVRGVDNALWYRSAGAVVTQWQSLGGQLTSGPAASAPPSGGPVTVVAMGAGGVYLSGQHTLLEATGTWSGWQPVPALTTASWNPHVKCWATLTTVAGVLGPARNASGGATFEAGGFAPGIPVKNTATPPCAVGRVWEYVEIHDLRVRLQFSSGLAGDGDRVGWLADPTQPLGPMTQIHGEISQGLIAAGAAPASPAPDTLIDVQGFVYWDPAHVNEEWHQFTGWEIHPLTGWRPAR